MKFILALLLLAAPVFAADDTHDLRAALDAWKVAMLKGDAPALNRLYHKDLTYTHSNAKTEKKAEAIAFASDPATVAKAMELSDVTVQVYGNTAIMRLKGDITASTGVLNHLGLLMVWLKGPQGWQLLARQALKLP